MAFNPNDDRFYDSLNKSGDQYRSDRYRVAEDQAATAREIGQMYGEAPQKALKNGMDAADWRQNREMKNQQYQNNQAEEGRRTENQGFERTRQGRVGEEWGIRKPMLQNDATISNLGAQKAQMEADYGNEQAGAEETQKLHYTGEKPLSRAQARLMRGDQADQLGLDTSTQNLANAKAQANNIAQQIAMNRQTMQDHKYDRAAQMAAADLDNIYTIKDPKIQGMALEDWRARNQKLVEPEVLTNLAAGGASRREAAMSQANANKVAETKLIFGPAIQEAQTMTAKLAATQQLANSAKVYKQQASFGGAYENPAAEDAREKAAVALASLGNHQAADHARNAHLAGARDVLSTQAQNQASETLSEFHEWYDRQDDKVRELPEVKRAYQQAQQLEQTEQAPSGGLRKLPSLVGGGGGGNHTAANKAFLTGGGGEQGGAQGYGQMQSPPGLQPAPVMQAGYFTQPPRPAPAAPAPAAQKFRPDQLQQGHGQVPGQVPGQMPMQDPYGLMKPRQGGYNGSR